jgi:hypothetical protein
MNPHHHHHHHHLNFLVENAPRPHSFTPLHKQPINESIIVADSCSIAIRVTTSGLLSSDEPSMA